MRGTAKYAIVLALFTFSAAPPQLRDLVGVGFDARVISVTDGDTVHVIPAGEKRAIRVRLEGVDAPERGEPFSDRARTFTRVMLFDQPARVEGRDVDRYGRLVARVVAAGKDASVELLKAGLACHYTYYSFDRVLAAAQTEARAAGRGFWANGAPKPGCVASSRAPVAVPRENAEPTGAVFRGNTSSHVYHAPSCRNYNCKNCTRVFRSEAEAQAAGFTPARDCLRR